MNNNFTTKELFAGCGCMDICHVMHFVYFPFSGEKGEEDENVIYGFVRTRNYFDRIFPPLRYFYDSFDWKQYFYYHWFRRWSIALRYILNSSYMRKWGVLDCFDFQGKDLPAIDNFMSLITNDITDDIDSLSIEKMECQIDGDQWVLRFNVDCLVFDDSPSTFPWQLQWEPQFKPRKFLGRLKWAFNYIFGNYSDEQDFEIYPKDAAIIRGMIKWIQKNNKGKNE